MKKTIVLLAAVCLLFFAGCGKDDRNKATSAAQE